MHTFINTNTKDKNVIFYIFSKKKIKKNMHNSAIIIVNATDC